MQDYDPGAGAARENLCRLLAACYYQPGPEFAEENVFASMLDAATRIHPDLAEHARRLGEAFSAEGPGRLLVDYTQLFLGPNKAIASPYGSVWMSGESALMQDSTMAALELYREGGFDLDEEFRELPDHIAAELEFLYLLIHRRNRAQWKADAPGLDAAMHLQRRFLGGHLGRWVGPFAAAVKEGAQSAFYRELAKLTEHFVNLETEAAAGTT